TGQTDMTGDLEGRRQLELDVLVLFQRIERTLDHGVDDLSRSDPVGEAHAGAEMHHRIGEPRERSRDDEIQLELDEIAFAAFPWEFWEDLDRLCEFDL